MKNSMNARFKVLGLIAFATTIASGIPHAKAADPLPEWKRPLLNEANPTELDPDVLKYDLKDVPRTRAMNDPAKLEEAKKGKVKVITFRRPVGFDYEFALLVVDDRIERAFVVSTAKAGKTTINGSYRLVVPVAKDKDGKTRSWAWRKSNAYENSPMYWAVQIHGGYFVHSSPHYGNLGKPASMGCVRTSLPDAQLIFKLVAGDYKHEKNYAIVFDGQDKAQQKQAEPYLNQLLASSGMTVEDLKARLVQSRAEITVVSTGDLDYKLPSGAKVPAEAHVRPFANEVQAEETFPKCDGANCWDAFPRAKRSIVKLSEEVRTGKAPEIVTLKLKGDAFTLKKDGAVLLADVISDELRLQNAQNAIDMTITMSGVAGASKVHFCDKSADQCWTGRGPEAPGVRADYVYKLTTVLQYLKSPEDMYIMSSSGEAKIEAITIRFTK